MKKRNRKLLIVGVVLLLYLLVGGFLGQKKQQELRSKATSATTLSFSPDSSQTSPFIKKINDSFTLDLMLSPGTNDISFVTIDLQYDPTKITLDPTTPVVTNTQAFPQTIEGPSLSPGHLLLTLGIGSDPTRGITQITKVATLQFKALASTGSTPTTITIGNKTLALSLAAGDNANENVLSSSLPAYVTITGAIPTLTPLPTLTSLVCSQANASADVMLLVDSSGSMNAKASNGDKTTKFAAAQSAAKLFTDQFVSSPDVRIGLKSFTSTQLTMTTIIDQAFTADRTVLKTAIDALKTSDGGTCIECAIRQAQAHIAASGRSGIKQAVVLLTDGKANATVSQPFVSDTKPGTAIAEKAALDAVTEFSTKYKPTIYVIGLGTDVNTEFLKQIAIKTGGKYYFPLSSDDLNAIYQEISKTIAKGSVSGTVFHDTNMNGLAETGEGILSGWTVQAADPTTHAVYARTTSGTQGDYLLDNLCNGRSYQIEIIGRFGWMQTAPKNPGTYSIQISKAETFNGKDFGMNEIPKTTFSYSVYLHGIGNSGDNTNPNKFDLSNKNPRHQLRPVEISFYDGANNLASTLTGSMQYSPSAGKFVGSVEASLDTVSTASYLVKIKTERYLFKRIEDVQSIAAGKANTLPAVTLTTGDVDSNNRLNILDYNGIISCYSDTTPAKNCTPTKKIQSDIDDDGKVNQTDYNLFLRELTVQNGD